MGSVRGWWKSLWTPKAKALTASSGMLLQPSMFAPPRKGTVELQATYRSSPWLHTVVSTIGERCASATRSLRLYDGPRHDPDRQFLARGSQQLDLLDVLDAPAAGLTSLVRWKLCRAWRAVNGEFGLIKQRGPAVGGLGRVTGLVPIAPQWIVGLPTDKDPFYSLRIGSVSERVHVANFIWCVDPDLSNPWGRGVGHGECLSDELTADEGAARMIGAWFANGGMPDVIVSMKGAGVKELEAAEMKWRQKYGGARKSHQVSWTGSDLEVKRLDTSFKDQDLVPLREYEARSIIQTFAISPELFGILDQSTRSSIDAAQYHFSLSVLVPWMDTLCDLLQHELVPDFGGGCWVGYERSDVVVDDADTKLRAIAVSPSAFRVRDVRSAGGFVPDPERGEEVLSSAPATSTPTQLPGGAAPVDGPATDTGKSSP